MRAKLPHACPIESHMLRLLHAVHLGAGGAIVDIQVLYVRIVVERIDPCLMNAIPEVRRQDRLEQRRRPMDT